MGVRDPYAHAGACDRVTDDGRCRYAFDFPANDPAFADERAADDYRCPAADGACEWRECPHFRSTSDAHACERCGLEERRNAHTDARPLLEEHHLAYADEPRESAGRAAGGAESDAAAGEVGHEIAVTLCRWCHAAVHDSWARIDDDVRPSPEAVAAAEGRRSEELAELGFESAAERARDSDR